MKDSRFMTAVEKFVSLISRPGFINSLSQTLIRLTAPGIPDLYQGCELWNFSLVDPDNRQPVDFKIRRKLLAQAKTLSAEEAWAEGNEPLTKLWLVWKTLNLRAENPMLFAGRKSYEPLPMLGEKGAHAIAFMRGDAAITIAQRLPATLQNDWGDTHFVLPKGKWRNVLTGDIFFGRALYLKHLLARFPVALLIRKEVGI
jgi:(1->4)-alpha-D-glucan 1-alpha-D-glucosylmutase